MCAGDVWLGGAVCGEVRRRAWMFVCVQCFYAGLALALSVCHEKHRFVCFELSNIIWLVTLWFYSWFIVPFFHGWVGFSVHSPWRIRDCQSL